MKTHEENLSELRADSARYRAQRLAAEVWVNSKLAAHRIARMGATTALHFLCWLCEELVNALLRPVWRRIARAKGSRRSSLFRRFEGLVNRADCWPCRIQYAIGGGLFITASGHDFDDEFV